MIHPFPQPAAIRAIIHRDTPAQVVSFGQFRAARRGRAVSDEDEAIAAVELRLRRLGEMLDEQVVTFEEVGR